MAAQKMLVELAVWRLIVATLLEVLCTAGQQRIQHAPQYLMLLVAGAGTTAPHMLATLAAWRPTAATLLEALTIVWQQRIQHVPRCQYDSQIF